MMGKRLDQHCAIFLAAILLNVGELTCFAHGDEPPSAERPMNAPSGDVASVTFANDLAKPLGEAQAPGEPALKVEGGEIDKSENDSRIWLDDPEVALKEGLTWRRPVLLHFHAVWAGPCQVMKASVFPDPEISRRLSDGFIAVRIDVDRHREWVERYKVSSVPCDVVLDPEASRVIAETNGLKSVVEYRNFLDLAASQYRAQEAKPEAASEQQDVDRPKQAAETQPAGQPGGGGSGGFGGGGFGSGAPTVGGLGLPESAIPGKRYTAGFSLIVAIADDDSRIFAYSDRHPRWAVHRVPKVEGVEPIPVVGQDAAAVMFQNICFAYSPLLGIWDQLTLPVGEGAQPVVGNGMISIHSPTKGDFVFKNDWGKWFSAEEIKAGAVARHLAERGDPDSAEMVLKMFHLKNIQAAATAKLLVQLYGADDISIVPEEGRNSLLVRGATDRLAEIEAVLLRLDTDGATTANPADPSNMGMPIDSRDVKTSLSARSESAAELRARYEDLERQVSDLAAKLRGSPWKSEVDRADQHALRNLVQKAFEARQRLQQAEIAGFARRLKSLQQSLETREKLRDQVVKRRVDELLNPGLKWEEAGGTEGTNTGALGAGTKPVRASSEQFDGDAGLFQVSVRDENGLVRVTFQPSPHSTLEQLKVGQRVMVSQTLRPIKAGFDHTPIIVEEAILVDFWQDRRRAVSNQPVTLQVRGQDVPGLIEAAKLGALEVHALRGEMATDPPLSKMRGQRALPPARNAEGSSRSGELVSFLLERSEPLQSSSITWLTGPGTVVSMPSEPVRIDTTRGSEIVLHLSGLGGDAKNGLFLILNVPVEPLEFPLVKSTIPLTLTTEDLEQALSGNMVTKVLYLPRKLNAGEPLYQTVVNTRLNPGEDPAKVADQRGTVVAALRLQQDLALDERSPLSSRTPKPDALPTVNGSSEVVIDPPYEPKSELEKSVAKLVHTFFQDQSRLAVPCLVLNVGDDSYAVTAGLVGLAPEGTPPAIDASHLEWNRSPVPLPAIYDSRSTKDFFLYRISENVNASQLTETWTVRLGDELSTLARDGRSMLNAVPVRVTEVGLARDFRLPERQIHHQFEKLFCVDRRLPEGTVLFHDGKLAGMTLLGTRYSDKPDVSYVVPADRLLEIVRGLNSPGTPATTERPGK